MAWVVKNKTKVVQDGLLCVSVSPDWSVWWALELGSSGAFRFKHGLPTLFTKTGLNFMFN